MHLGANDEVVSTMASATQERAALRHRARERKPAAADQEAKRITLALDAASRQLGDAEASPDPPPALRRLLIQDVLLRRRSLQPRSGWSGWYDRETPSPWQWEPKGRRWAGCSSKDCKRKAGSWRARRSGTNLPSRSKKPKHERPHRSRREPAPTRLT